MLVKGTMGRKRKGANATSASAAPTKRTTRNSTGETDVLNDVLRRSLEESGQEKQGANAVEEAPPSNLGGMFRPATAAAPTGSPEQLDQSMPRPTGPVHQPARDLPSGELLSGSLFSGAIPPVNISLFSGAIPPVNINPLTSVCDPLGEGVPKAIQEKIGRGEYVELNLLLENWGGHSERESGSVSMIFDSEGHPVLRQVGPSKPKITSISTWTSAFLVYTSIYLSYHPHRSQEILKYMQIVRSAAIRFGSAAWSAYDTNFRIRHQRKPQNSWAIIDAELWFMFVATSSNQTPKWGAQEAYQSYQRPPKSYQYQKPRTEWTPAAKSNAQGSKPAFQDQLNPSRASVCFDFNGSKCTRKACKFDHSCSRCGKPGHGSSTCWS